MDPPVPALDRALPSKPPVSTTDADCDLFRGAIDDDDNDDDDVFPAARFRPRPLPPSSETSPSLVVGRDVL